MQVLQEWLLGDLIESILINSGRSVQKGAEMFSPALEKPFLVLDQGFAIRRQQGRKS